MLSLNMVYSNKCAFVNGKNFLFCVQQPNLVLFGGVFVSSRVRLSYNFFYLSCIVEVNFHAIVTKECISKTAGRISICSLYINDFSAPCISV